VSEELWAAAVCAVASGLLAAAGQRVLARLPEPEPDEPDAHETDHGLDVEAAVESSAAGASAAPAGDVEVKIPYAVLAARPRLAAALGFAGAVVGAVVGRQLGFAPVTPAWVFLAAVGVVLGYIDWQTRLLPTRIIAPSYAVLVVLLAVAVTIERDLDPALRSVYGWLAFGGFYLLLWFVYPRGLGYGDVRLSGLLGLALGYLGWGPVLTGMYAGFLIGGVGGGLLAAFRLFDRKHFPFGPFMLIGALVGLVWGQAFADWYSGF
jgi:leader peptidase (prepilin peptidase) / N-methyltransferase